MTSPQKSPPPDAEETDFLELARNIWLKPRETIRVIVDYDPRYLQRGLILALSLASGLLALRDGLGMMMLETVLNFVMWIVSIYGTAFLLLLTGKLLKGKATFMELVAALTWSMIPALAGLLAAFALRLAGGVLDLGADVLQVLLSLYSFHLWVLTVAEVQRFPAWKAGVNHLLVLLVLLIPVLFFIGPILAFFRNLIPGLL
ncbi:MAG TPA: YIP1 family protein [Coleofasciculaceae cyanobacterium]|jgi:hypothetical protein